MNIEQIAQIVDAQMYEEGRFSAATAYPEEFLRRCLSKLAEQAGVEPSGTANDLIADYVLYRTNINPNDRLYTEDQLIAAQQRTAEACAKVCENLPKRFRTEFDKVSTECAEAIRRGDWREYP